MAQVTEADIAAVDLALTKARSAITALNRMKAIINRFRREIDMNDDWDDTLPDYDVEKAKLTARWTSKRDAFEAIYADFKTYVQTEL